MTHVESHECESLHVMTHFSTALVGLGLDPDPIVVEVLFMIVVEVFF